MIGKLIFMLGKTEKYIHERLEKDRGLLFTVIDPDDHKTAENAAQTAKNANEAGSDLILIGGSTLSSQDYLDDVVKRIKENVNIPVVLFPGNVTWLTKYADALYFMSLLNSTKPYWISGAQIKGAPIVKKMGLEPISVAYLVVEPGGTVGKVAEVELLKRSEPQKAAEMALAAQYMGYRFVVTDAGSKPKEGHIPLDMIKLVASTIDVPYIVAGGIRTPEQAKSIIKAGADAIQVGAAFEQGKGSVENIRKMVEAVREGGKGR
jgi:phosphoglycerol geranylgeranyltransferase